MAFRRRPWLYAMLPGFLASLAFACSRAAETADIVHANWAFNGLFARFGTRRWKKPLVTTLRGSDVNRARTSRSARAILSHCARYSDALVTVSQALYEDVAAMIPGIESKLRVIANGVDPISPHFDRSTPRAQGSPVRIVSVGSLISRKGVDLILRAVASAEAPPNIELSLVGDGPERMRLEYLARELGIAERVRFAGSVPPSDVLSHLRSADAFVLASHSEGRPNAILEALAAELPVIASDVPGTRELVHEGITGRLFPDGDYLALAGLMRTLVDSPENWRTLASSGREWILRNNLTWDACATAYTALYSELLG